MKMQPPTADIQERVARVDPVVIPLHLSRVRYGAAAVVLAAIGVAMAFLSTLPTLVKPNGDFKAQEIGRTLESVDRVSGAWPLAAALAVAFLAASAFLVWALAAKRSFDLRFDEHGIRWPSLAPWRAPFSVAWSEVTAVEINQAGDHLVFRTKTARRIMPAWWLPPGTSPAEAIRAAVPFGARARQGA